MERHQYETIVLPRRPQEYRVLASELVRLEEAYKSASEKDKPFYQAKIDVMYEKFRDVVRED